MKPVRLLCDMFSLVFLDLTLHKVHWHSYHFKITEESKHRINLFSYNLRTKNKGLCTARSSGSFQNKLHHSCFNFDVCRLS